MSKVYLIRLGAGDSKICGLTVFFSLSKTSKPFKNVPLSMLRLGELVLSGLFVRQMENDFLLGFLKLVMDLFDLFVFSFNSLFSSPETPEN